MPMLLMLRFFLLVILSNRNRSIGKTPMRKPIERPFDRSGRTKRYRVRMTQHRTQFIAGGNHTNSWRRHILSDSA
jgi:hypothetical protein